MRLAATLLVTASLALGGCATDPTRFETRIVCTLDREEAHVLSKWWAFSIGSEIAQADAVVACQPLNTPSTR